MFISSHCFLDLNMVQKWNGSTMKPLFSQHGWNQGSRWAHAGIALSRGVHAKRPWPNKTCSDPKKPKRQGGSWEETSKVYLGISWNGGYPWTYGEFSVSRDIMGESLEHTLQCHQTLLTFGIPEINGGFTWKFIYKSAMFYCHVWFPRITNQKSRG